MCTNKCAHRQPYDAELKRITLMLRSLWRRLNAWRLRCIARHKLAKLSDHLLADMGTERSAIADFVARRSE